MNVIQPISASAIDTKLSAIFVSLELSRISWVITSMLPGGGDKMSKHVLRAGDVAGLFDRFAKLRHLHRVFRGRVRFFAPEDRDAPRQSSASQRREPRFSL